MDFYDVTAQEREREREKRFRSRRNEFIRADHEAQ